MFYKVLDKVKVIEYGNFISAPFCARILADLGAEVIKIEDPCCGDDSRRQSPFLDDIPGLESSGFFQYLNMNKLGVTLNPETATGKKMFRELLKSADVFVENNTPQKMKALGLSYKYVKQINPRLVMTSITPFGQTGPYKDYQSCELVSAHIGGVGYISMREGDISKEPIKLPAHLFSFQAGLSSAVATLSSIYRQSTTGLGEQLDVSEQESVIQNLNSSIARYSYAGQIMARTDAAGHAPFHILPCKDGYICAAFVEEAEWRRFVEVMGHPEWGDNELFKDFASRAKYWDALRPLIVEWTMQYTEEEIYRRSQEKAVPLGAVRTAHQVLRDKQMAARQFFVEIDRYGTGKLTFPGVPYRFSGIQREAPAAAPLLGQHNEEIYCGHLGYTKRDLTRFREAGVI
ncbi:MAG: CaiB/BaiF CoA transferase family protein [Dehalococcoidales bacterium]